MNVLKGLPRDELFHSNDEQLLSLMALGVLRIERTATDSGFSQVTDTDSFVSMMVYVPRDRYNTSARKKMELIIRINYKPIAWILTFNSANPFLLVSILWCTPGRIGMGNLM